MREQGLSGNALKVIAIVAMTIDHLAWMGKFFYYYYPVHILIPLLPRQRPLAMWASRATSLKTGQ